MGSPQQWSDGVPDAGGGSPAERYARSRTALAKFAAGLDFELDDFQERACAALERGSGVLVAAPTGAGKTVVAEFAISLALASGTKAFYTTPIKALSNQKYRDLAARFGAENVGLLTGDTAINSHAPVVVMTTEVLRNMLYAGSDLLDGLGYVVMDEVHYLADRFRGPVWEEVIIHLDPKVQLVSLSATVSNAEELGDWLELVRGDTEVIVSEHRPVPLWQQVLIAGDGPRARARLLDLYASGSDGLQVDGRGGRGEPAINPELAAVYRSHGRDYAGRGGGRQGGSGRGRGGGRQGGGRQYHGRGNPSEQAQHAHHLGGGRRGATRAAVVIALDDAALLPAIYFIFSRAGCDDAVSQLLAAGVRLTTASEEKQIRAVIEARTADLPAADLDVLGFWNWQRGLRRGIAAHHAGLLPVFKETVEELFAAGLIKVVFATETLALGINMPARTVVLEKLVKWDGTGHEAITAGEYTQLTGRAGRRGIDVEGHAVVVDHPRLDPGALAGLASRRTYPLRSSFRPTYNMAVNLIASVGAQRAREVLELSFAQFQADRGVVSLARQVREQQDALRGYTKAMTCERGDVEEYLRLRSEISAREKAGARQRRSDRQAATLAAFEQVRPGDVLEITNGRRHPNAIVLGGGGERLDVLTGDRQVKVLNLSDVAGGMEVVGRVRIPRGFNRRRPEDRRDLVSSMRNLLAFGPNQRGRGARAAAISVGKTPATPDAELDRLRAQLRAHPVHNCPDRADHLRWAERWRTLEAERQKLLNRIDARTSTVARTFDKTCHVLTKLGYLAEADETEQPPESVVELVETTQQTNPDQRPSGDLAVTADGRWLQRIYAENDLLLAECLRRGAWNELNPAALAAVLSTVIYNGRGERTVDAGVPGGPKGALAQALDATTRIWSQLTDLEQAAGLDSTGELDQGLVTPIYRWASGKDLAAVLRGSDLAPGDFVRWCKQIVDVLDQLVQAAPTAHLQATAAAAKKALLRGIVAYSSV